MNIETLVTLGYYISSIGFLIATLVTYNAASKSSESGLKNVLNYLFIGTGVFFVITVFQKLAESGVWGISEDSVDIWWHIMFYLAMISYYLGFKKLASLGSTDASGTSATSGSGKTWGIVSAIVLLLVFILPGSLESTMIAYEGSKLGMLGLHHFIAFALAGVVGAYVFSAKIFLGQIGRAIAGPMIIAVWALAFQHLWELLTESWKVFEVTSQNIEGVEKIFLTIAAVCVIFAANRLKAFAHA